ncbi:Nrap protein [Halteromyces radiatus]|uniref:Nrap protein n=1 Tax=Halteromyces radiatus TaxID=101107 RepID=UPI00221EBC80|nr:Nrap protein [Halteromyces radiatus]KAI8079792.1 Nrap protein [Halteromyces radiatus]
MKAFESDSDNGDWESQSDEDDDNDTKDITMRKKAEHVKDIDVAGGELEGLKETAELFKSNIFKLELDELLSEVNAKYDKHTSLEKALHHLKTIFDAIPEGKETLLNDFESTMEKKHKIKVPFPQARPAKNSQYKFKFIKPSAIHIVGSYALKFVTRTKSAFNVDVAVEMPSSIFQEKDHMNNRYFYKRACYLSVLANAVKSSKKGFKVKFGLFNGDIQKPILLINGSGDKSDTDFTKTKAIIRIIPYINSEVFSAQRLGPGRNCLRAQEESTVENLSSTPQYNASILQDTSYTTNLAYLYQHSKNCAGFKDAIVLAKTWLYQRGLATADQSQSGWNGFLFSMIMGYLLQSGSNKKLSNGHSSYQLLRGTIDFLANHNFETEPVFLGTSTHEAFSKDNFKNNYDVVIVDPSGTVNLASKVTKSGLAQLQHEAKIAMNCFNDSVDRFEDLFLKNVNDSKYRFDNAIKLQVPDSRIAKYDAIACADEPYYPQFFAKQVGAILIKGLSNRAELVSVQYTLPSSTWDIDTTTTLYDTINTVTLTVGLILNPDTSSRLVDQGPDAQDKEACKVFSEFWGKKSELRRFKDGSILESVVWETQGYENKSLIVEQIVRYLFDYHLKISGHAIRYWAGQLYPFINYSKSVPGNLFNSKVNIAGFQPVNTAFTQFTKQLRAVDDGLPLLINNIYPLSSSLRQASVLIPHPVDFSNIDAYPTSARFVPAMDVSVQLERSGKWPDDLQAMQKVKEAFYIKIAELFKERNGCQCTVVHTEQTNNPYASSAYLDIFYHGFVFRCHLLLDQEGELLNTLINNKTTPTYQRVMATEALDAYNRLFRHRREHTFGIQALCARFPAFSTTMRLVKRWFGAHLLSALVPEEVMELLCGHVFLSPLPWTVPTSGLTGFSRVLGLLSSWDWETTPLMVDLEGDSMTPSVRDTVMEKFTAYREQQHSAGHYRAMVIATTNDVEGERWWWKTGQPSRAVAMRIQGLAQASCNVLEESVRDKDLRRIFVTPMQDYNKVIHLDSKRCTRYYQNMHPQREFLADLALSELGQNAFAQLDSVTELVKDIQNTYGDLVMVFYDKYGGDKIALVWNPLETTPRPWKVSAGYNTLPVDMSKSGFLKPVQGETVSKLAGPNISAILAEIERLGQGYITQIV